MLKKVLYVCASLSFITFSGNAAEFEGCKDCLACKDCGLACDCKDHKHDQECVLAHLGNEGDHDHEDDEDEDEEVKLA